MSAVVTRDVPYARGGIDMIGMLVSPVADGPLPGILLFHDAFGLGEIAREWAHDYAALGYAVFAADVWGNRLTPTNEAEIGPLIGGMVADREGWHGRAHAALTTARSQPEIDPRRVAAVGYCFGGSTALELLRTGGELAAAVSVHGGLDLLAPNWSRANSDASVLICTGADDPMATAEQRDQLTGGLDETGIDWCLEVYSGTVHGFTNPLLDPSPRPAVIAYNARSARRAWRATEDFLTDIFATQGASHA